MQKLPNPPWYRRWSIILAGVIVLAAGMATLGLRGLQQVASPSTTTATIGPVATVPTQAPTTRPAAVQPSPSTTRTAPGVLWQAEGSDTHRSRLFRAPQSWRIVWSFDCSEFAGGGGGNFKLSGEGAFEEVLIQEFDVRASGSRSVSGGGFGRLVINSVCEHWEVRAVRA